MRSRATALQPAIALVEEQMSTVALTPSISAVMQWSSPVQPGTECMVTCVMSGPVVASKVFRPDRCIAKTAGTGVRLDAGGLVKLSRLRH